MNKTCCECVHSVPWISRFNNDFVTCENPDCSRFLIDPTKKSICDLFDNGLKCNECKHLSFDQSMQIWVCLAYGSTTYMKVIENPSKFTCYYHELSAAAELLRNGGEEEMWF